MTQIFEENGTVVPVTVIEAGPCPVVQVRTTDERGLPAPSSSASARRRQPRPPRRSWATRTKAGLERGAAVLREFSVGDGRALPSSASR